MKNYKSKGIEVEGNGLSQYSYDIESELTKMLSEQLAREIDREILKSIGFEPDRNKRRKNKIKNIFNPIENNK